MAKLTKEQQNKFENDISENYPVGTMAKSNFRVMQKAGIKPVDVKDEKVRAQYEQYLEDEL